LLELMSKRKIQFEASQRLFKTLEDVRGVQVRIKNGIAYLASLEVLWEDSMPVGSTCFYCGQIIKK
jgi:hypothetical protein